MYKRQARERSAYLLKAADLIDVHHDEIRDILIAENGKTHYWADFEIDKMAEIIRTLSAVSYTHLDVYKRQI